jgi:Spy/CpxP family protein refolding chaperone
MWKMEFSSDRRRAAALVALVFVLGVAFGVAGVLAGRRVLGAGSGGGNANGNGQGGQQVGRLVRDLQLSAEQERQFRQVLADTRARYDSIRDAMEPQFRDVRNRNRERIGQILTAEQKPLFDDFLRTSRNRRNDNDRRLVERLTQQLRLTAEQQTQLADILRDTRASFDALRQQMNPQFEEARLQNRERLRQIVTAEQRPGLDAFFQRRDEERRRR